MSENELARGLLRDETPIDLQALTDRVLKRDRRRMWFLGIACVIAWMMVVMLPWGMVLPMIAKVRQVQVEIANDTQTTREHREQSMLMFQVVKTGTLATLFGSIASMFIAAVCTVWLIIHSRRATLRQVNARLAEISEQLKIIGKAAK